MVQNSEARRKSISFENVVIAFVCVSLGLSGLLALTGAQSKNLRLGIIGIDLATSVLYFVLASAYTAGARKIRVICGIVFLIFAIFNISRIT